MIPSSTTTPFGLLVLGMHRSGTSAVTSFFDQLGFHCGQHPMPSQPANPRGYFEDRVVVDTHDRFLTSGRFSWSDPRPFPAALFEGTSADTTRRELADLMSEDFLTHERWVVKDPRLCRLLPLWQAWTDQRSKASALGFLHVARSPQAVAKSLERREGFGAQKSVLLWLRHYLESEIATRGRNRTWLNFEDLESQGVAAMSRAMDRLQGWPSVDPADLDQAFAKSFSVDLVHFDKTGASAGNAVEDHPWLARAYRALQGLAQGEAPDLLTELDTLRAELADADQLLVEAGGFWESEFQQDRFTLVANRMEQTNLQVQHVVHRLDRLATQPPEGQIQGQHLADALGSFSTRLEALEAFQLQVAEELSLLPELHESTSRFARDLAHSAETLLELRREIVDKTTYEAQCRELEFISARSQQAIEALSETELRLEHATAELAAQRDLNTSLESEMAGTRQEVEQKQEELEEANRQLEQARGSEEALGELLVALEVERVRLAQENSEAQARLDQLQSQLSWRVMKPFRELHRWFHRDQGKT